LNVIYAVVCSHLHLSRVSSSKLDLCRNQVMKSIRVIGLKQKMRWTVTLTLMKGMNLTASRRRTGHVGRAEWWPKPIRYMRVIQMTGNIMHVCCMD